MSFKFVLPEFSNRTERSTCSSFLSSDEIVLSGDSLLFDYHFHLPMKNHRPLLQQSHHPLLHATCHRHCSGQEDHHHQIDLLQLPCHRQLQRLLQLPCHRQLHRLLQLHCHRQHATANRGMIPRRFRACRGVRGSPLAK